MKIDLMAKSADFFAQMSIGIGFFVVEIAYSEHYSVNNEEQ